MKLAVVGHVEWVDFVVVGRLPRAGEILHAESAHEEPAGGGGMAAYALRSLTGRCAFYCAVGDDARAQRTVARLGEAGIDVRAGVHAGREQRRVITYLTTGEGDGDGDGDRTITVLGPRLVPHGDDAVDWAALASFDGVFLTAGDAAAVRAARGAKVLVATPRARDPLIAAGVSVDVLVGSAGDPGEAIDDALVAATRPRWIVQTEGAAGGSWRAADGTTGRWDAVALPGAPVDDYGCGDAFAAALTAALARGDDLPAACALGARVGAALLCERAPVVGELSAYW
ncbi:Ribokinase [Baekduia alba]|uniref:PfkB family carbohydrate kinase n=1 Tax=Baekduia alba TaxID=2997333 RepID=UPI002340D42B|nr:PfkB family carbohydrate kinase [Baekduia alba]WCB91987.1 Ribokinase [Baekduia alba]